MTLGFRGIHPVTELIFYILTFAFCLISSHPVCLISGVVCALCYDIKLRGNKAVSFFCKVIIPLTVLSGIFNGFVSHYGVTPLFTLPDGNSFTLEAVIYGLIFALRASATLIWLNTFNEIITNDKIIFLFGRISPRTALIISMALRFIPLISSQSEEINSAQKGIGSASASDSFINKIKSASKRLSILVSRTMERGIDTADSMKARGYGLKHRTAYNAYIFSFKDLILILFSVLFTVLFILSDKSLLSTYNPVIKIPFPDAFSVISILIFCLFMLFPLILDISEEKKWSISD